MFDQINYGLTAQATRATQARAKHENNSKMQKLRENIQNRKIFYRPTKTGKNIHALHQVLENNNHK